MVIKTTADKIKDGNMIVFNPDMLTHRVERIVKTASYYKGRKPFQILVRYEDGGSMWFRKKEAVWIGKVGI